MNECPNQSAILEYLRGRGVSDVRTEYAIGFGWSLRSKLEVREPTGELTLCVAARELSICWGGGGLAGDAYQQIKPDCFQLPFPPPVGVGPETRALEGYLGCPVTGKRFNCKRHPWDDSFPVVDRIEFHTDSHDDAANARKHFEGLGYVTWIMDNMHNPGGVVFMPKLDTSGEYDRSAELILSSIEECLGRAEKKPQPHFLRVARAVLDLPDIEAVHGAHFKGNARGLIRWAAQQHLKVKGWSQDQLSYPPSMIAQALNLA